MTTPLLTQEELTRFAQLREDLFRAIEKQVATGVKPTLDEGQMAIIFPAWQEGNYSTFVVDLYGDVASTMNLDEYWEGITFTEALDAAEKDIRQWIAEVEGEPNGKAPK